MTKADYAGRCRNSDNKLKIFCLFLFLTLQMILKYVGRQFGLRSVVG